MNTILYFIVYIMVEWGCLRLSHTGTMSIFVGCTAYNHIVYLHTLSVLHLPLTDCAGCHTQVAIHRLHLGTSEELRRQPSRQQDKRCGDDE